MSIEHPIEKTIEDFEKSTDKGLLSSIPRLEFLVNNLHLDDSNKTQIEALASLMITSGVDKNYELLEIQLLNLESLSFEKKEQAQAVRKDTSEATKGFFGGAINATSAAGRQGVSNSTSINSEGFSLGNLWGKITDGLGAIDINNYYTDRDVNSVVISGSASFSDMKRKIKVYADNLRNNASVDLSAQEISMIERSLMKKVEEVEDTLKNGAEIGYNTIESYFDELAKNGKHGDNGEYTVDLDLGEQGVQAVTYASKEDAMEAIRDLKIKAEKNFQNGLLTLTEGVANILVESYKDTFVFVFDKGVGGALEKAKGNFLDGDDDRFLDMDNLDGLLWGVVGYSIAAVFVGVHFAVGESVKRGLLDIISMKDANRQIDDYGERSRHQDFSAAGLSEEKTAEFLEYKQRDGLMTLIWNHLDTLSPGTPEYIEYQKKAASIEKYKLNDTPTFYYLSYKLLEFDTNFSLGKVGHNLTSLFIRGGKLYVPKNPFTYKMRATENGKTTWNSPFTNIFTVADKQALYLEMKKRFSKLNKQLEEGVKLFYDGYEVKEVGDTGTVVCDVTKATKTEVYNNLLLDIHSRNISSAEKKKLVSKLNGYINELRVYGKTEQVIHRELYLLFDADTGYIDVKKAAATVEGEMKKIQDGSGTIKKITNSVDNSVWKLDNTSYAKLGYLLDMIQKGTWVGTTEELDSAIKSSIEGKRVQENYDSRLKDVDFEDEFNAKETELRSQAGEYNIMRGEFFDDSLIDGNLSNIEKGYKGPVKGMANYIDYISPDSIEKSAAKQFKDMMLLIHKGELILNKKQIQAEINLIVNGYTPSYAVRDILDSDIKKSKNEGAKKLYTELSSKFNAGETIYIKKSKIEEFKKLFTSKQEVDNLPKINDFTTKSESFIDIDMYTSSYQKLHLNDLLTKLDVASHTDVRNHFSYLREYMDILWESDSISKDPRNVELDKFFDSVELKNNYTITEAGELIQEIIDNKKFDDIKDTHKGAYDPNYTIKNVGLSMSRIVTTKLDSLSGLDDRLEFYSKHADGIVSPELKSKFDKIGRTIESDIGEIGDLVDRQGKLKLFIRAIPDSQFRRDIQDSLKVLEEDIRREVELADAKKVKVSQLNRILVNIEGAENMGALGGFYTQYEKVIEGINASDDEYRRLVGAIDTSYHEKNNKFLGIKSKWEKIIDEINEKKVKLKEYTELLERINTEGLGKELLSDIQESGVVMGTIELSDRVRKELIQNNLNLNIEELNHSIEALTNDSSEKIVRNVGTEQTSPDDGRAEQIPEPQRLSSKEFSTYRAKVRNTYMGAIMFAELNGDFEAVSELEQKRDGVPKSQGPIDIREQYSIANIKGDIKDIFSDSPNFSIKEIGYSKMKAKKQAVIDKLVDEGYLEKSGTGRGYVSTKKRYKGDDISIKGILEKLQKSAT